MDKENKEYVYIRAPMPKSEAFEKFQNVAHHSANCFFSAKSKLWMIEKDALTTAHPGLKDYPLYPNREEFFTKGGNQLDDTVKNSIGTAYTKQLGEKVFKEYETHQANWAKSHPETEAQEAKEQASEQKEAPKKAYYYVKSDKEHVAVFHQTEGAKWLGQAKVWSIPADKIASAHPDIAKFDVFANYEDVKANKPLQAKDKAIIGKKFDAEVGKKLLAEHEQRKENAMTKSQEPVVNDDKVIFVASYKNHPILNNTATYVEDGIWKVEKDAIAQNKDLQKVVLNTTCFKNMDDMDNNRYMSTKEREALCGVTEKKTQTHVQKQEKKKSRSL